MQKTVTFLMFVGEQCGKAEEAMNFYTSLFPESEIKHIEKWAEGEPGGSEGWVKLAQFTIAGQEYMVSENSMGHQFGFTPAISIYVNCETEAEIDDLYSKLMQGGQEMMPIGDYGIGRKFGWTSDKYGVSWQLCLA